MERVAIIVVFHPSNKRGHNRNHYYCEADYGTHHNPSNGCCFHL
jgi:hypothetical protein